MAWVTGPAWREPPPSAHLWVVQPSHAVAAVRAAADRAPGTTRPRVLVDGRVDVESLGAPAAVVECAGGVTAAAVQRALQLGPVAVAIGALRGAAFAGGAAWYHGWRRDPDRNKFAGALAGAVALRGTTATGGDAGAEVPLLQVDHLGGFHVAPIDREAALGRLLLEPNQGPQLAEAAVDLGSILLSEPQPRALRGTGIVATSAPGSRGEARIAWQGAFHYVAPTARSPGSAPALDLSERTLPVLGYDRGDTEEVPAGEVLYAWAVDHGDHTVVALAARQAQHWPFLEEWASATRAALWLGVDAHVTRTPLPNLSAIRFVCSAPARRPAAEVVEAALGDRMELDEDDL